MFHVTKGRILQNQVIDELATVGIKAMRDEHLNYLVITITQAQLLVKILREINNLEKEIPC